jgi:hypothetical protein
MRSLVTRAAKSPIFVVALVAAVGTPLAAWFWWYSGPAIVPGLVTSFAATFLAFLVALDWERRQRREDAEKLAAQELDRRRTEARRAFSAIGAELEQLQESVESVVGREDAKYFLPDLPTHAWRAARERLTIIVADTELMASLGRLYSRVDDLLWRLRFLAERWSVNTSEATEFNPMIDSIANEVLADLEELHPRVREQATNPSVQVLGIVYNEALVGQVKVEATLETRVIRAGDE